MPIDEEGARRPGINWDECVPVEFGDGQEWYLPRPTVDVFAIFSGDAAEEAFESSFGPEFDALLARVRESEAAGFFPAVAGLAAWMLRRNYELSDADLRSIVRYRRGDDSGRWMEGVLRVANGNEAPKASADGSA